ncbi:MULTISPECIES: response regulator [Roseomonadaceae]|uniref:Response regulator n=1 Tax=Falsiroseomonas oleicola TaxID=2801474 RepID=A0ABS6HF31_9PROT|nr:response regulator [Roseomonas oleicola]MBU8545890.1 response regulator [Roseomonas oleicola]
MNMPISLGSAHSPAMLRLQSLARLSVLLVDDEVEVLEELAGALGRRGLDVLSAGSAEAALAVLRGRPDVATLVSDIRMPGMDGLALAEAALRGRAEAEALEVVLVTGYASSAHGMAAARLGAFGVIQKPMRGADLARMVQEALARAGQRRGAVAQPGRPRRRASGEAPPSPGWTAPGWTARAAGPPLPQRPTAAAGLPPIAARVDAPIPARPATAPRLDPSQDAEALLHRLARHLDAAGNGIEAIARDLRGPLGDLLRDAPRAKEAAGAPRGLLALLDDLMDIAALEAGSRRQHPAPISAHGLLDAVALRLSAMGLRCGRRIILQPDADPAFLLDSPRLVRAMALLAGLAIGPKSTMAMADLSIDAGAGQARLDLLIRPAETDLPAWPKTPAESRLPIAIARHLVTLQGGRLDAWPLPEGGLRARMLIRGG